MRKQKIVALDCKLTDSGGLYLFVSSTSNPETMLVFGLYLRVSLYAAHKLREYREPVMPLDKDEHAMCNERIAEFVATTKG